MSIIRFKRIRPHARMPARATVHAAAYDLYAAEDGLVEDGAVTPIGTGLAWEPEHTSIAALILPRSGLALRNGIIVVNSPGIIDSDYRGEIKVLLSSVARGSRTHVSVGDRIAQIMFIERGECKLHEAVDLGETGRGESGFGSTGR